MAQRILIKMRPQVALDVTGGNLRPLHEEGPSGGAMPGAPASWFVAETDAGENPWDAVHARVADQLGVADADILDAEPDILQHYDTANEHAAPGTPFAIGANCQPNPQQTNGGRIPGPDGVFAWHLGDLFSELGSARAAVTFTDPRTRIAHIDTGYDKMHSVRPEHILSALERNFVTADGEPNNAQDPDNGSMFDNSGHGTGTIGILAGGKVAANNNEYLGGAYGADILPLRIANSVVQFYTSVVASAIQYAIQQNCDVITMSMGGLPAKTWNQAVNDAYLAGICFVAASGDCFGGSPSHHVVYPARYHRVIPACGVMANGAPHFNLNIQTIEGSWGPDSSMTKALATYTPNIPWARIGCPTTINLDGQGTSAATPQIAAAAALWYEKYKAVLPRDWRRVEAVRNALFTTAKKNLANQEYFGSGILQANKALAIQPVLGLDQTPPDDDSFAFLRVITGLGVTDTPVRESMFNTEVMQRYLRNPDLQKAVPDPNEPVSPDNLREFTEALVADPEASRTLRSHIKEQYTTLFNAPVPGAPPDISPPVPAACAGPVPPREPVYRRIRTYAVDPSFSTRLDTAAMNQVVLNVTWEKLKPGPEGEYIRVTDQDQAGKDYGKVDLDSPHLLAQDGFAPSEGNPYFHQQMVYAVAMTTIQHFEHALGRPVLWRPKMNPENEFDDSQFVRCLVVRPHALHDANAYYSPQEPNSRDPGLLFGYFEASGDEPGDHPPGSKVYACLSHDIVAHETTHAILDGLHTHFNEPTNPDVLALHEAFADIVALMQHFTISEVLEHAIAGARGDLESENILGSLAIQFGHATGARGALRDAIGTLDENKKWSRQVPDPAAYKAEGRPHEKGAILVAAVFDAFLAIYRARTADLLRIYTGGTGVLPQGAVHPDLVHRLAREAATSAGHVLNICIRAVDYLPPVDVTFTDYLRALVTADSDAAPDDRLGYRVAFMESFRRRGICPPELDTISVDTLRWTGLDVADPPVIYTQIAARLKSYADSCLYIKDREKLFEITRQQRAGLHEPVAAAFEKTPEFMIELGLDPKLDFEVHELRTSSKFKLNGQYNPQVIVALTQQKDVPVPGSDMPTKFLGGCTLIVDLTGPAIQYSIYKRIASADRLAKVVGFVGRRGGDPLQTLRLQAEKRDPFALLHSTARLQ